MFLCYFANCSEFLRDSSRIEPIPPNIRNNIVMNIRNDIVNESGLTRTASLRRIKIIET